MERVSIDDIEDREASTAEGVCCGLSDPLETTDVAINHYRLAPDDGFPGGLHAHMDQAEIFVVIEGAATFETYAPHGGTTRAETETVAAGEAIRFAPGEFQSGWNESDKDCVALALGAPRNSEDVRIPVVCPDCGHESVRLATEGDTITLVCPDCGDERVPTACPECGHDDLRVTLGDRATPIVVCQGCGVEFEQPPIRNRN